MSIESFFTPYEADTGLFTVQGENVKKILVLAPHPDDEVFGCGGALHQMQQAGVDIQVLIITDGVPPGLYIDDTLKSDELRREHFKARIGESNKAAKILGYPEPQCLGLPDGSLNNQVQLEFLLEESIAKFNPDLVLSPSIWEMHRDHRAVAETALILLQRSNNQFKLAFFEIGLPLVANHLVNITKSTTIKNEAMLCFTSQLETQNYDTQIRGLNQYRTYTLDKSVEAVEAYHVVDIESFTTYKENTGPGTYNISYALKNAERFMTEKQLELNKRSDLLNKLRNENKRLSNQLADVYSSTSWRLSAPIRFAGNLLKKLKHSERN